MNEKTEIIRTIQIEDKTIHVHIHLSEDEIRRLLLPHVANAFADELRRKTYVSHLTSGSTSVPPTGGRIMSMEQQKSDPICRTCKHSCWNTIDGECEACYVSKQPPYIAANPEETSPERGLAQKILDYIKRTRKQEEIDAALMGIRCLYRVDVLVDDIEALCAEQLTKE